MTTYIPSLTLPASLFASPVAATLLPVICGTAIGFATPKPSEQYMAIRQPPLRPPPWIFGPVWTALYGAMGYASYRACTAGVGGPDLGARGLAEHGATLYTIQLALNFVWMPLFFYFKRPVAATVDIVALTGTVGYLAYLWGQVDTVSGWLLAPYLGWLSFATYLSAGAGYLNGWDFSEKGKAA